MKTKFIIGIDEAGRGPLAGPVSVGAVIISSDFDKKLLKGIRDSKKLSELQRNIWFRKLKIWKKEEKLNYAVTLVGAHIIDKRGISFAIRKAISKCMYKLNAHESECEIFLDGSLKAPKKFLTQKTIIGGDDKVAIISLAAIAAKVTRDKKMARLARLYPNYGFDIHVGYGTLLHRKNIKKYGLSEIHRQSFCKNLV